MSSASFNFEIFRESGEFNFVFDYSIDGYNDPESEEYFGDTRWQVTYSKDGGFSGGYSDYASESGSGWLQLGLEGISGSVNAYSLSFWAENWFTAVGISASWRIFSVAYDTTAFSITGSAGNDVFIGGSGDDVLRGLAGNDLFDGGEGDDIIDAGDGNDRLDGGFGDDVMIGGKNDDVYIVDSVDDSVVEKTNGGMTASMPPPPFNWSLPSRP